MTSGARFIDGLDEIAKHEIKAQYIEPVSEITQYIVFPANTEVKQIFKILPRRARIFPHPMGYPAAL